MCRAIASSASPKTSKANGFYRHRCRVFLGRVECCGALGERTRGSVRARNWSKYAASASKHLSVHDKDPGLVCRRQVRGRRSRRRRRTQHIGSLGNTCPSIPAFSCSLGWSASGISSTSFCS